MAQTDVFSQVRFLVQEKGMTLENAIYEVERKLHSKLPLYIINLIKEEANKW